MSARLRKLREELGALGWAALALIAAVAAFHLAVLKPLAARSDALAERASREAPRAEPGAREAAADKLGAVYEFLRSGEQATDVLAKLHGIGAATGVQLRSASYRSQQNEQHIVRYEITLPVSGSYAQIRQFLARALAEIPVMSLDQVSLKREHRSQAALQAELRLTLHMVKS